MDRMNPLRKPRPETQRVHLKLSGLHVAQWTALAAQSQGNVGTYARQALLWCVQQDIALPHISYVVGERSRKDVYWSNRGETTGLDAYVARHGLWSRSAAVRSAVVWALRQGLILHSSRRMLVYPRQGDR